MLGVVRATFPELKSERARQNRARAMDALHALQSSPPSWFCPDRDAVIAGKAGLAFTVLEALGRLEDHDEIRTVAAALVQAGPMTAAEAVRRIRRARRVTRTTPGDMEGAVAVVLRAVNGYLAAHPDAWDEVTSALEAVRASVESDRPRDKDRGQRRASAPVR
jgi:hypothetical protein